MVFVDLLEHGEIDDDDRHHLGRVLRVRDGEPMVLCDGRGSWRPARFGPVVEITGEIATVRRPAPSLTLGFALIKGDRPELVVQKLTELGIDRIVGFTSDHGVVRWDAKRADRQLARWRRVAREAAMQCRRTHLPEVADVTTFAALVAERPGAVMADFDGRPLDARWFEGVGGADGGLQSDGPTVLIGPEGGWSEAERGLGLPTVRVGEHVLRAETASIAAATLLAALRANGAGPIADP